MRLFNKVAIIGVGLIGGSIALNLKKKKLAKEVIGVSRHKKTLLIAKKIGAIDKGSLDLHIIKDADLVILATPVNTLLNLAPRIARIIKRDCIVTDVGSTKQEIVSKLGRVFTCYIGSHPLAGSERRSIINADPNLFKGSVCILTPTKSTDKKAQGKIVKLWKALGSKVVILSPQTHDKVLSFVSHLPHILAFSLISTVPGQYLKFASGGLKDTTRIAASDSELWADIFISNKNISRAIALWQRHIARIKKAINKKDKTALNKILHAARRKREVLA